MRNFNQVFTFIGRSLLVAVLATSLGACQTTKKSTSEEPSGLADNQQGPISTSATGSDSGQIEGLVTVNFDYDSASLSPETREKLSQNVEWMKKNPKLALVLEGHCDERGSNEYNLVLGERRAQAVRKYMASLGVDENRLAIVSYGEERPLVNGDDDEVYAKNRRVNFVPTSDVSPSNRQAKN